jgi:hypothetical protein
LKTNECQFFVEKVNHDKAKLDKVVDFPDIERGERDSIIGVEMIL